MRKGSMESPNEDVIEAAVEALPEISHELLLRCLAYQEERRLSAADMEIAAADVLGFYKELAAQFKRA